MKIDKAKWRIFCKDISWIYSDEIMIIDQEYDSTTVVTPTYVVDCARYIANRIMGLEIKPGVYIPKSTIDVVDINQMTLHVTSKYIALVDDNTNRLMMSMFTFDDNTNDYTALERKLTDIINNWVTCFRARSHLFNSLFGLPVECKVRKPFVKLYLNQEK